MRHVAKALTVAAAIFWIMCRPVFAYDLGAGDRIRIQVLERPELTSTYVVDQDGAISLPGVGVLQAAGVELRAFEDAVRDRLADGIIAPSVAIQLEEARPVFVLGSVRTPGAYPYRAGLRVLQAVAIAGGGRRTDISDVGLQGALAGISAEQGADANLRALLTIQVRVARLQAELAGRDDFGIETIAVPTRFETELDEILLRERALMAARRQEQQERIATLEESIRIRSAELDSYEEQLGTRQEYLDIISEELAAARSLQDRGLTTRDRSNELLRDQSSATSSIIQTETLLNQARAMMAQLQEQRVALETGFRTEVQQALRIALEELASAQTQLKANEAIIDVTGGSDLYNRSAGSVDYVYTIQRGDEVIVDGIGPATILQPDDVLIVDRPPSIGPVPGRD